MTGAGPVTGRGGVRRVTVTGTLVTALGVVGAVLAAWRAVTG